MIEVILLVVVGAATLLYLYVSHKYNYWCRKGVAQPPIVFGFGNILDAFLMKKNRGIIHDEIYRSYHDHEAVGVYQFTTPYLIVRSPALVQRIMVSDFSSFHDNEIYVNKNLDPYFYLDPFVLKGQEWKHNRTKLTPTLTPGKIKEIYPLMKEIIPRLDDFVANNLEKDIELKELATLFAMDSVSNTVFGIISNCFSDPNAAFRKLGDLTFKETHTSWLAMVMFLMPRVRDLLRMRLVPKPVNDYIEKLVQDVMDYRLKNNITRNDLFQQFLKKETGNNLHEMMMYGMTFFLEGFETSAMMASTTLYELALNPEVQQTLYNELTDKFGDKPVPDYDTINNFLYLDKVLQESLRKYPVLFAYIRECTKPISLEIDGKTVEIESGTPVIVPVFSLHHDDRYYTDPEVFDPERFSEESKASRTQYTYMPFGEGPRICPGSRFGLTQVKLLVSDIVYKYKILRCERTPDRLTFSPVAFMASPNEELWVRLEKRK